MSLINDEEKRRRRVALPEHLMMTLLNARRRERLGGQEEEQQPKRAHLNWNRECASLCMEEDYWGPIPRFRNRDFDRVFRITILLTMHCSSAPFNCHHYMCGSLWMAFIQNLLILVRQ